MVTVYYTFKKIESSDFVKFILNEYYNIPNAEICKSNFGKPYVKNEIFFNVTHSESLLAVAVSDTSVGIDCEFLNEKEHIAVLSKFSAREQKEINSPYDFYEHWTAKEAFIKYIGTSIAKDLKNVEFFNGKIYFCNEEQPISITRLYVDNYTIACVSKNNDALLIKL